MIEDRAQDLLSAALRHVRDAEQLAGQDMPPPSLDQAYHLAGFGPECARKAVLPARTYDKAIGHGVTSAGETALAFALATDPAARRYEIEGWGRKYAALAEWQEGARYERTGTRGNAEVHALVVESRAIVDRIVFALWADGAIPGRFTW